MRKICCWLWLLILTACQTPEEKLPVENQAPPAPLSADILEKQPDTIPYNIQIDTVIHISFDSIQSATAKGAIGPSKRQVYCYVPVSKKQTIRARLIPSSNEMNIRFSQLIFPDRHTDGPFGKELVYAIKEPGMYQLLIAPNNMASGKITGDFEVEIKLVTATRK